MENQNEAIFGSSLDAFRIDSQGRKHSFAGTSIQCVMLFPDVPVENSFTSTDFGTFEPGKKIFDLAKTSQGSHYKFFAELQTISISSAMSTYPVRALGKRTADTYLRGARVFAGSIIFTILDKDVLYEAAKLYRANSLDKYAYDEIPPFDIIINATNEYGQIAYKVVSQVVLSHGGEVYSIDDIFLEQTFTFQARHVTPFLSLDNINDQVLNSQFNGLITPRDLMDANTLRDKAGRIYRDKTFSPLAPAKNTIGNTRNSYARYPYRSYQNMKSYEEYSYAERIRNYILKTEGGAGPKL